MAQRVRVIPATIDRTTSAPIASAAKRKVAGYARVSTEIELRSRDDNGVNGTISGGSFVNRLWNLMEWKSGCRYTVFGDLAPVRLVNDEPTLVFDLEDSYMSDSYKRKGAKQHEWKQPHPADHSEQFGLGVRAEELLQG